MARLCCLLFVLLASVCWAEEKKGEKQEKIPGVGPTGPAVKLHTKFVFTEGPAADREGNVYFSDIPNEKIHKVDHGGKLTTFREKTQQGQRPDGQRQGRGGGLRDGRPAWPPTAPTARSRRVLADRYKGKRFNAPNDLVIDKSGGVYFTDPAFGAPSRCRRARRPSTTSPPRAR